MTCMRCYGPDNGTPRCDRCEELDERDALRDEAERENEPSDDLTHYMQAVSRLHVERDALREALREAQPYVFNRTQEPGWRGETARLVLARVKEALS